LREKILVVSIVTVVGILTTLTIGYLTVEPLTGTFILLAGLLSAILIALLLKNIRFAIPLLIVLAPITFVSWFIIKIDTGGRPFMGILLIVEVTTIVIFPCLLLYKSIVKGKPGIVGKKIYQGNLNIILFILMGWIFLSILWSPSTLGSLYSTALFFIHFFMYLTFITLIKTEQDLNMVVRTFFIMATVIAATMLISVLPVKILAIEKTYFFADWFNLKVIFNGDNMRATGLTDEKTASEFVGFGILVSLLLLSYAKDEKRKYLLVCLLILLSFAVLFAQSKSATIGLLIGILILSIVINRIRAHFIRNLFRFTTVFILIFGIFLITQSILLSYRGINKEQLLATSYVSSSGARDSVETRENWWNTCYKDMVHNNAYLYGLGIGGCGYNINLAAKEQIAYVANPHSAYFSLFFDLGLIGVFLFLLLILLSGIKVCRLMRDLEDGFEKDMLWVFLCCAVITGVVAVTEKSYYQNVSIWVLSGIGVSAFRLVSSKQSELIKHSKK